MNKQTYNHLNPQIATALLSMLTLVLAVTTIAVQVVFLLDNLEKLAWDLSVITSAQFLN
jgi:hypothetical protein